VIVDERAFFFRTTLTPNFQIYADCFFHFFEYLFGSRPGKGAGCVVEITTCSYGSAP
jgi:hypothetical protein